MPALNDSVFDSGLSWAVTNGTQLHILSSDVGLAFASIAAAQLGEAAVTQTGPANGATDGRSVTCPETAITPAASGTATHWAITNNADTVVASGALSASMSVTNGTEVTVASFPAATIRDAA